MSYALDFKAQSERQNNPVSSDTLTCFMSKKIHHVHDGFFRAAMSNVQVAQDLLKAHLSQKLIKLIAWDTLQITNKSYVDENLKQTFSDMVYRCQINGRESYIYVLVEQQTAPYPLLPFTVLKYDVMICEEHIKQGHKELPLIANLVIYSGKKSPYPYSLDIYDCFQETEMAKAMMFKPVQLVDLGQEHEEELATHGEADMLELLLKQSQQETFVDWLDKDPELVKKLAERDYFKSGLVYMFDRERGKESGELESKLTSINPSKKEDIMGAVQTLRERSELIGEKRGMQIGEKRKQKEMAERLLLKGMDIPFIEDTTGLPAKEIMKISEKLGLSKK